MCLFEPVAFDIDATTPPVFGLANAAIVKGKLVTTEEATLKY